MLLFLSLLGCIFSFSVVEGDTYHRTYQSSHHHHHQRREHDITHHVRYGSRVRDYCQSGYWNARGNCVDNVRVNYVVVDRPGGRRCHYIISGDSSDGRVYDATCSSNTQSSGYYRNDFEKAPLSRHAYGDVYGEDSRDYRVARNQRDRAYGDPLYRNAPLLSVVSSLVLVTLRIFM